MENDGVVDGTDEALGTKLGGSVHLLHVAWHWEIKGCSSQKRVMRFAFLPIHAQLRVLSLLMNVKLGLSRHGTDGILDLLGWALGTGDFDGTEDSDGALLGFEETDG